MCLVRYWQAAEKKRAFEKQSGVQSAKIPFPTFENSLLHKGKEAKAAAVAMTNTRRPDCAMPFERCSGVRFLEKVIERHNKVPVRPSLPNANLRKMIHREHCSHKPTEISPPASDLSLTKRSRTARNNTAGFVRCVLTAATSLYGKQQVHTKIEVLTANYPIGIDTEELKLL